MVLSELEIKILSGVLHRMKLETKCITKQVPVNTKKNKKRELALKMAETLGTDFLKHLKF